MNNELIEKLTAIREDLVAFQALAQAGDAKKLAELVNQKMPVNDLENAPMWRNYLELQPYMNADRESRTCLIHTIGCSADDYLKVDKERANLIRSVLIRSVTHYVPFMLDALDEIEPKTKQPA